MTKILQFKRIAILILVACLLASGFALSPIYLKEVQAAATVTTLGTNSDKLSTSPWTALSSLSLTADDYVFVTTAADSGDTAVSARLILDSQTINNTVDTAFLGNTWLSYSWVATNSATLSAIEFQTGTNGTPTGNINIYIYLANASHQPTGSSLTSGSIAANVSGLVYVGLTAYNLTASTEYCVVFTCPSGDSSNYQKTYCAVSNVKPTWYSSVSTDGGASWTAATNTDKVVSFLYGVSLVADATGNNATNVVCKIWSGQVTVTGTAYYIVITNTSTAKAMTAIKVSGLAASALDATTAGGATGTGTTATTPSTGTLSQADEVIIAVTGVEDETDDAHGSWTADGSHVSGNEQFAATNDGGDSSNVQVHSVAEVVAATTAQHGDDGAHDSNDWAAAIAGYKVAASYSISNTPSSKVFGIVAASTTYYAKGSAPNNPVQDGDCTFSVSNDGASAFKINIHGHNFTGGVGWTLGAPGENQARITTYYSGQDPASGVVITTSDQQFYASLAAAAHLHWDFKLESPTSFTDGTEKSGTLTLTAVAED